MGSCWSRNCIYQSLLKICVVKVYELQVSKPQVIIKEIDGVMCEPFERVQCEVPQENAGAVIESLGSARKVKWLI